MFQAPFKMESKILLKMDYKKELEEAKENLRKLCGYKKDYNSIKINELVRKVHKLQIKINQESQKTNNKRRNAWRRGDE